MFQKVLTIALLCSTAFSRVAIDPYSDVNTERPFSLIANEDISNLDRNAKSYGDLLPFQNSLKKGLESMVIRKCRPRVPQSTGTTASSPRVVEQTTTVTVSGAPTTITQFFSTETIATVCPTETRTMSPSTNQTIYCGRMLRQDGLLEPLPATGCGNYTNFRCARLVFEDGSMSPLEKDCIYNMSRPSLVPVTVTVPLFSQNVVTQTTLSTIVSTITEPEQTRTWTINDGVPVESTISIPGETESPVTIGSPTISLEYIPASTFTVEEIRTVSFVTTVPVQFTRTIYLPSEVPPFPTQPVPPNPSNPIPPIPPIPNPSNPVIPNPSNPIPSLPVTVPTLVSTVTVYFPTNRPVQPNISFPVFPNITMPTVSIPIFSTAPGSTVSPVETVTLGSTQIVSRLSTVTLNGTVMTITPSPTTFITTQTPSTIRFTLYPTNKIPSSTFNSTSPTFTFGYCVECSNGKCYPCAGVPTQTVTSTSLSLKETTELVTLTQSNRLVTVSAVVTLNSIISRTFTNLETVTLPDITTVVTQLRTEKGSISVSTVMQVTVIPSVIPGQTFLRTETVSLPGTTFITTRRSTVTQSTPARTLTQYRTFSTSMPEKTFTDYSTRTLPGSTVVSTQTVTVSSQGPTYTTTMTSIYSTSAQALTSTSTVTYSMSGTTSVSTATYTYSTEGPTKTTISTTTVSTTAPTQTSTATLTYSQSGTTILSTATYTLTGQASTTTSISVTTASTTAPTRTTTETFTYTQSDRTYLSTSTYTFSTQGPTTTSISTTVKTSTVATSSTTETETTLTTSSSTATQTTTTTYTATYSTQGPTTTTTVTVRASTIYVTRESRVPVPSPVTVTQYVPNPVPNPVPVPVPVPVGGGGGGGGGGGRRRGGGRKGGRGRRDSPLVFDMNRDSQIDVAKGMGVRMNQNNQKERNGAAVGGDKMLAMCDFTGDGEIDGAEVFGDGTRDPFKTGYPLIKASNGFEALRAVADSAATQFPDLNILRFQGDDILVNLPALQTALRRIRCNLGFISDENVTRLESLRDAVWVKVNHLISSPGDEKNGVMFAEKSWFLDARGKRWGVDDVWFPADL